MYQHRSNHNNTKTTARKGNNIVQYVQENKTQKLAIVFGKDFGQNVRALKAKGYTIEYVETGAEAVSAILKHKDDGLLEELVILSHGYEGGIIGEATQQDGELKGNTGIYNEHAWPDNAYDDGKEFYEENKGEDEEFNLLENLYIPENATAYEKIEAYMEAYTNQISAYVKGNKLMTEKGAVHVDQLAEGINEVGITASGHIVLAGCNLGVRDEIVDYRRTKMNNEKFTTYKTFELDKGGFAGDLARLTGKNVYASSPVLRKKKKPVFSVDEKLKNNYYTTGKTEPYPKSGTTLRRQCSLGGWTTFHPNGEQTVSDPSKSVFNLTNPENTIKP